MSCLPETRLYVWHRRNHRGRVIRLAREAYLRPGLVTAQAFRINALHASHIILCDSVTLLSLLPALEELNQWPDPPVVLLCRSVVEGLAILGDGVQWSSARNLWLKSISTEQQSLFVPVENVFDADVWKPRLPDQTRDHFTAESISAIREALQPLVTKPIVVVGDLQEYLKTFQSSDRTLQEIIQPAVLDVSASEKATIFPEHWTESKMRLALRKCEILQGRIKVRKHRRSAVVTCGTVDVIIDAAHFNRAIDGDVVAVQLIDEPVAEEPLYESHLLSDDDEDEELDDDVLLESATELCGRVVGILQRCWRPYVGTITAEDGDHRRPLFVPIDKRIPRIRVFTRQADQLINQKLVVRLDRWLETSRLPEGHIVSYLGESGDIDVEVDAILNEHGIHQKPYVHANWYDQLPANDWTVPEKDLENRRDFRESLRVCSIDPPGCVDIDDALSVRELPNGDLEFGVHIADVTAFLKPGSRLDKEALNRSTTVYLSDRRLNMIPELLSENLCSLHENVDRLAVSVLCTFSKNNEMKVNWFGRSVIRSRYALSYSEAEAIVQGKTPSGRHASAVEMLPDLKNLQRIGRWLRSERISKGALEIDSFEAHFNIEDQDGRSNIDMELHEDLEFHSIVAELMIAANSAVAHRIWECYSAQSLLRRHLPPDSHKFAELQQMVKLLGGSLDTSSNKSLADSMRKLSSTAGNEWIVKVVRSFTARCLTEAQYICSAGIPPAQFSHYGLAAEFYTHFTSPIRRYADIIVHRLLLSAIADERTQMLSSESLAVVCQHINDRNRSAKLAQRDCSDLFWALFISGRNEIVTSAIVISFTKSNRIGIFIPKFGRKASFGLIHSDGRLRLGNDGPSQDLFCKADLNPSGTCLKAEITSTGQCFTLRLFDCIMVRIRQHESGSRTMHPRIEVLWDPKKSPVISRTMETQRVIVPQDVVLSEKRTEQLSARPKFNVHVDVSLYYVVNNPQNLIPVKLSAKRGPSSKNDHVVHRCGNRMIYKTPQPDTSN